MGGIAAGGGEGRGGGEQEERSAEPGAGRKETISFGLPLSLPPAEQAPFQRQMHPIGRLPWRLLRALSCRAHLAQGGKALTAVTPESSTSQAIGSSLKLILGTKRKQNLPKSPWGHRILPSSCTVRASEALGDPAAGHPHLPLCQAVTIC